MGESYSWLDHVVLALVAILLAPLQILAAPFFVGYIALNAVRRREPTPYRSL